MTSIEYNYKCTAPLLITVVNNVCGVCWSVKLSNDYCSLVVYQSLVAMHSHLAIFGLGIKSIPHWVLFCLRITLSCTLTN